MKKNSNKMYEPIKILPPGVCPSCHKAAMAYREQDVLFGRLDDDGIPGDFVLDSNRIFTCLECGFTTDKYIMTDSGFRFNPHDDDEFIKSDNKTLMYMDEVIVRNPLMKMTEEENDFDFVFDDAKMD